MDVILNKPKGGRLVMKKNLSYVIVIMFIVMFFNIQAKAEDSLVGTWKQIEDQGVDKGKVGSYIDNIEKNGAYFGKITKFIDQPC